jgi:hypothetical protein
VQLKDRTSPYLDVVQRILSGLAKVRLEAAAWRDSEWEEQARETQVFKIGECLRPFYLSAKIAPDQFRELLLPRDILFKDTDYFLKHVSKTKFFPSPYSPIPDSTDQYTDFAAFVLDFCGLSYEFWRDSSTRGERIAESCRDIGHQALEFLLDTDNCLIDEAGCRWGGTNKYRRVKKTEELYTDTYFTSVVILALQSAVDNTMLALSSTQKELIKQRIRQAGTWIVGRFDDQLITGDESKANRKLLYTTWGLRALIDTNKSQDKETKAALPEIATAYLRTLQERKSFTYEQEYLTILSQEVDQPLYYEDRSGLGGILLTLASLREVPELEGPIEVSSYAHLLDRLVNAVLSLRDPSTGLWYNQQFILSIHSYLTEAFLRLDRHSKGFGSKLEVSGYMIRSAVKDTLLDETVINSLQQAIYDRVLRLIEQAEQGRIIEEGVSKLREEEDTNGKPRPKKRVRSRRVKK